MELYACPDGGAPTIKYFETQDNVLMFARDVVYEIRPHFPELGYYYYAGQGGSVKTFEIKFRSPYRVISKEVRL